MPRQDVCLNRLFPVLLLAAACSAAAGPATDGVGVAARFAPGVELTDTNFDDWYRHITPTAAEMAWTRIPWHLSFGDGLASAGAQRKPLLLWVMNGHPFGCT